MPIRYNVPAKEGRFEPEFLYTLPKEKRDSMK